MFLVGVRGGKEVHRLGGKSLGCSVRRAPRDVGPLFRNRGGGGRARSQMKRRVILNKRLKSADHGGAARHRLHKLFRDLSLGLIETCPK